MGQDVVYLKTEMGHNLNVNDIYLLPGTFFSNHKLFYPEGWVGTGHKIV